MKEARVSLIIKFNHTRKTSVVKYRRLLFAIFKYLPAVNPNAGAVDFTDNTGLSEARVEGGLH